jgi:hypothetical protein
MKIKNTPYIISRQWKDNIADYLSNSYKKLIFSFSDYGKSVKRLFLSKIG